MTCPIYLDYNGTTPLDPAVIEAMRPHFEHEHGNPSSSHYYGIEPKRAVQKAREQTAALLGCSPGEVMFTSGGTESNNHALKGVAWARKDRGNHLITSEIEHPAILEVCRYLERSGFRVTYLPVDEFGLVSVADVEGAIRDETILITIMHANNEVGTIQPIEEISQVAGARGIVFHTDAAQSVGKIPTDVTRLGVDLLSVAGHKVYAPKGVGALFVRGSVEIDTFMHGAGQERGMRAGTENVMGIVGLGQACAIAKQDLEENRAHMQATRDMLDHGLAAELTGVRRNGHPEQRLPNTLSVSFRDTEANRILEEIGLDVAASAGAACHSDSVQISHVLQAMHVPQEWAKGTLRFSTGRMTSLHDISRTAAVVAEAVHKLRT